MINTRKTARTLSTLMASVALGAVLVHGIADYKANQAFDAAAQNIPGLKGASISADPISGRVRLSGLTLDRDGVKISVGKIEFPGAPSAWAFVSSAQAYSGSAKAENITISAGTVALTIPRVEFSGTNLSDDEVKALFDGKATSSFAERFGKINATSVTVPEITFVMKSGEIDQTIKYRDLIASDIQSGRVGQIKLAGADVVAKLPKGEMKGAYGAMEAKGVDLVQIARFATEARGAKDEPLKAMYDTFTMDGFNLSMPQDGKSFTVSGGKVAGAGVKGRPTKTGLMNLANSMPKADAGQKLTPEQNKAIFENISDLFDSMEMGQVEARDIVVSGKEADKDVFTAQVGRVAMDGFGGGKLGGYSYENIDVKFEGGRAQVGVIGMKGFDIKNLMELGYRMEDAKQTGKPAPDVRQYLPKIGQILVSGVDVDAPAKDGNGNAQNGSRVQFRLGKYELNGDDYVNGIPTKFSMILDRVAFEIPSDSKDAQLRQILSYGYNKLDLSAKIDLIYDEKAQTLAVKEVSTSGVNMGALRISGLFGNVSKDLFASDTAVAQGAALSSLIKNLDIRLDNTGLYDKVLAVEAKKQNTTPDQLRAQLTQMAALGIPAMLQGAPAGSTIGTAVSKFLAAPKNLSISLSSAKGLGAADLALINNPAALLQRVDVKASAND